MEGLKQMTIKEIKETVREFLLRRTLLYKGVQCFTVDSVKTDTAIKRMQSINIEIKALEKELKNREDI